MSSADSEALLASRLRTLQLILVALTSWASIFLVITLFLRLSGDRPNPFPTLALTHVGLFVTASILLAYVFVPGKMVALRRRQLAQGKGLGTPNTPIPTGLPVPLGVWCDLFAQQMILGSALLEGTAFYWLITYLLEGSPWSLGIAAVCIGGMALRFPTRGRLERWIDQQLDLLQQDQMDP